MDTTNQNLDTKLSAIDKALAAAKARKALKDSMGGKVDSTTPKAQVAKKSESVAPSKKDESTKQAREVARAVKQAELKKQREERAEARNKARSERSRNRNNPSGQPAHMKKIEKAAAALPRISEATRKALDEITSTITGVELESLALHIQHYNRVQQTKRALKGASFEPGDEVRVVSGAAKYIGKTGVIDRAQRIRCFVRVHGASKPVYLFTSDVELLNNDSSAAE